MKNTCTGADLIIENIALNDETYTAAHLDTYPLNDRQVYNLAEALKKNSYLNYINLFDCHLSEGNLRLIIDALKKNKGIKHVIINEDIGENLFQEIIDAVSITKLSPKL
tara:strand:+ start:2058 stop:2384 length:327 start_codon:yes stop_codon:yes gene_type:complete